MSYLGRSVDAISNVEKLDNITFNGGTTYALTKSSAAFTPAGKNNILISVSGVVQQGNFSVSGSNIVFDSAVAGTETCDFIMHYGTGLITTPADDTVAAASIKTDAVTTAKIQNDAVTVDKLNLISTSSVPSLEAKGTSGQTEGYIQLNCAENSHGIKLKSPPHSAGQSYTLTFPSTAPASNKIMQTDGSGNLSFVDTPSGTLVPISSVSLSGNTNPIIFDDVFTDTYNLYQIHLNDLCPTNDGVSVRFRFRDGSSTLGTANHYEHVSATVQSDSSSFTIKNVNNDDNIQIGRDSVGHSATTSGISGIIEVPNPRSTASYANIHYDLKSADGDQYTIYKLIGAGAFKGGVATAVEGFVLTTSNNGFTSGRIDIYGVKNAS